MTLTIQIVLFLNLRKDNTNYKDLKYKNVLSIQMDLIPRNKNKIKFKYRCLVTSNFCIF